MEMGRKPRKRKMTTLAYWHRLLKEANIEVHEVERIAMDRVKWKNMVESRMRHIEQFEKQQGHQYRRHDDEEIIERRSHYERVKQNIQNESWIGHSSEKTSQNNGKCNNF